MTLIKWEKIALSLFVLMLTRRFASSDGIQNKENEETLRQTLSRTLRQENETIFEFGNQIKNKNVVVFLGGTKKEKTALFNYLNASNLPSTKSKIKDQVKEYSPQAEGILLLQNPEIYSAQGEMFVDFPDFDHNKDAVLNILNAIFLKQIQNAKTVKFVIVSDINEISNFQKSLQKTHQVLSKCTKTNPSVSMIFNNVPKTYTQETISNLLKNQVLNNVINNNNLIGFLKKTEKEGSFGVNIKKSIEESEPINFRECTFTLSNQSKEALLEICKEYLDSNYFKNELKEVIKDFGDFLKDKWAFASYDEELNEAKTSLEEIKSFVEKEMTGRKKLYEIQNSLETLLKSPVSQNFTDSFELLLILDRLSMLEDQHVKSIQLNYEKALEKLLDAINGLLAKIEAEIKSRKENHILFPSKREFLATSYTITRQLMSKVYGVTSAAYKTVEKQARNAIEEIKEIPKQENLPQIIITTLRTFSGTKPATLKNICSAAEKAAEVGIKYLPEGLAVGGLLGVGAGGGEAYFIYQEIYGSRFQIRRAQNRDVYGWI